MKALPFIIVALAILLGLKQHSDSVKLEAREQELKGEARTAGAAVALAEETEPNTSATTPQAKAQERGKKPTFDAKLYLSKFLGLVQKTMAGDYAMGDDDFIRDDLVDATAEDILHLPDAMREAGISAEWAGTIYETASSRLLDQDPVAACEFAIKGQEIMNFIRILRTWISRDPVAAGQWMERMAKADPPLDEKTLGTHYSHQDPLDLPSLRLAASIAASPSQADLGKLTGLDGKKLTATLDDVLRVLPADGLPVLLRRFAEEGRADLVERAILQHPDPTLAREYLQSASLPPEVLAKAAQLAVSRLDPASMPRGMDWYLRTTEASTRGDGFKIAIDGWTRENPRSAAGWIATLPEGADRVQAEEAYRDALAHPRRKGR